MISLKILKIRKRYFLLGVKSDEDPIYYYSKKKNLLPTYEWAYFKWLK